jgi:hypothetical protein
MIGMDHEGDRMKKEQGHAAGPHPPLRCAVPQHEKND